jgi:hypothetical protein
MTTAMVVRAIALAASALHSRYAVLVGGCLLAAGCGASSPPLTRPQVLSSYTDYAACLNRHGVEVQVARTGGLVWIAGPGAAGPGSASALAAERDCKSLVPRGGLNARPTPLQNAQNLALMLRYAECMRAHGVSRFPDPTAQGLRIGASSGIDADSPVFRAAEKDCENDNLTVAGGV